MEAKFLLVVIALSAALFLAYLWGRRIYPKVYWWHIIQQLDEQFEHMTELSKFITMVCLDLATDMDTFTGAMMEIADEEIEWEQ